MLEAHGQTLLLRKADLAYGTFKEPTRQRQQASDFGLALNLR